MDDYSLQLLQIFTQRSNLSLIKLGAILDCDPRSLEEPINYLCEKEYLCIEGYHAASEKMNEESSLSFDTPLTITFKGLAALNLETKSRKHYKYNELRAWITLGIAILAFILSVINSISIF